MRVLTDKQTEVVRHYRTIEIADGPLVDVGAAPTSTYYPGTMIRADRLKLEWVGDTEPVTVLVSGPYQGDDGSGRRRYEVRYRMQDGLPDWVAELLQ